MKKEELFCWTFSLADQLQYTGLYEVISVVMLPWDLKLTLNSAYNKEADINVGYLSFTNYSLAGDKINEMWVNLIFYISKKYKKIIL